MDQLLTPADVERLAAASGKSLKQVCREAKIATTTFSRWKSGATEPTLGVYRRLVAAAGGASTAPAATPSPPDAVEHANDQSVLRGAGCAVSAPMRHRDPVAA